MSFSAYVMSTTSSLRSVFSRSSVLHQNTRGLKTVWYMRKRPKHVMADPPKKYKRKGKDWEKEVICFEDIPNFGLKGEVRKVAPGYIRNTLRRRKVGNIVTPELLEKYATPENLARIERIKEEREIVKKQSKLAKLVLPVKQIRIDDNDTVLDIPITAEEISDTLIQDRNIFVEPEDVILPNEAEDIRMVGEYSVLGKYYGKYIAFKVDIQKVETL
eukprot:256530_1